MPTANPPTPPEVATLRELLAFAVDYANASRPFSAVWQKWRDRVAALHYALAVIEGAQQLEATWRYGTGQADALDSTGQSWLEFCADKLAALLRPAEEVPDGDT